jgi:deoxyribodipyrimidine photo-lyase
MKHGRFATRADGLQRLADFSIVAGAAYTDGRNTDPGPGKPGAVSRLSSYLRYRLITEEEVFGQVLSDHCAASAQKFLQEVFWRTYWKGWLEMRPTVWTRFLEERDRQREGLTDPDALSDAEQGRTGIEGFDDWARELVDRGYLHNHARMWFASIWIFTLRLPWTLGADFFLRHLVDADASSNTLSWRWVAGLQTPGKTYLATTENIARYSNGRFAPKGLAKVAVALTEPPLDPVRTLPETMQPAADEPFMLLVTHEDMNPETMRFGERAPRAALVATVAELLWGAPARDFTKAAAADTARRLAGHFQCPVDQSHRLDADALASAAEAAGTRHIIAPYAPVGPVAQALARLRPNLAKRGIVLTQQQRDWDRRFWPLATKGFFAFRSHMPGAAEGCEQT